MINLSGYGKTKAEIMSLIGQKKDTLTQISKILDLAPSTVNKHINELLEMGAIRRVETGYARKWKHYELADSGTVLVRRRVLEYGSIAKAKYPILILAIFALAGIFVYTYSMPKFGLVPLSVTDPPQVPYGTTGLNITYSSVSINYSVFGETKALEMNQSGTLDLIKLVNVSQVIDIAKLPIGAIIKSVSFRIVSANISEGNSTFPVIVMGRSIRAILPSNTTINSSSAILLDLSSVVVPVYSNNSLSYELLPYVNARMFAWPAHAIGRAGRNMQFGTANGIPFTLFRGPSYNVSSGLLHIYRISLSNSSISSGKTLEIYARNGAVHPLNISGAAFMFCNNLKSANVIGIQTGASNSISGIGAENGLVSKELGNGTVAINLTAAMRLLVQNRSEAMAINLNKSIDRIIISASGRPYLGMNQGWGFMGMFLTANKNGTLSAMHAAPGRNPGYEANPESNFTLSYTFTGQSPASAYNYIRDGSYRILFMTSDGPQIYAPQSLQDSASIYWKCKGD